MRCVRIQPAVHREMNALRDRMAVIAAMAVLFIGMPVIIAHGAGL